MKRMTVLSFCFLSSLPMAWSAEPITVPMTAEHWQAKENAEFFREAGFYRGLMRVNSGTAALKDVTFTDGTIEFDINTIARGMPGIHFRQQDDENYELVYLRPDPKCPAFTACIQYAPTTHGASLWELFPQYQNRAALRENGWNHIRMVISGKRMNVFVNDVASPTLSVGRLEGDSMKGGVRLRGPATFANLVITPGAVEGLSPEPVRDMSEEDRNLVRDWRLSAVSTLRPGKEPMYSEMPDASQQWKPIHPERNGLVNISREYGIPVHAPDRGLVWVKTTIRSDSRQTRTVNIGWTREMWVFVNGKPVYSGKNFFEVEDERKFPDARCTLDNGSFPLALEAGDNEVAVAIANNFFGWAVVLRVGDLEGVHLAAK